MMEIQNDGDACSMEGEDGDACSMDWWRCMVVIYSLVCTRPGPHASAAKHIPGSGFVELRVLRFPK